ncbi:hypothetical protein K2Z84_19925 [Candidatus Binatia bacterium]|nr:hypothetical protein [Candidatus Binatia bacterium]
MHRSLLSMAALALSLAVAPAALAAGVTPPATKWQSSLTEPTPATGSDWTLTKASQAQISVSTGSVTIKLKLNGVTEGGVPVTSNDPMSPNKLQVDLRYNGGLHTLSFDFDLVGGKTDNSQTKFVTSISALPGGAVSPDASIVVQTVRCIQGGNGPGAGLSFCAPGLTAK